MHYYCVILCASPATHCSFQQSPLQISDLIHNWQLQMQDGIFQSRFLKSTHISIISNSVTHLRSFTNSAIAGNSARSPMSPHRAPISSHRMMSVLVFHGILQCFKSVSWCFASGSRCFTMYHCFTCLMMFYYVKQCFMMLIESRNDRNHAAADHLRDRR